MFFLNTINCFKFSTKNNNIRPPCFFLLLLKTHKHTLYILDRSSIYTYTYMCTSTINNPFIIKILYTLLFLFCTSRVFFCYNWIKFYQPLFVFIFCSVLSVSVYGVLTFGAVKIHVCSFSTCIRFINTYVNVTTYKRLVFH